MYPDRYVPDYDHSPETAGNRSGSGVHRIAPSGGIRRSNFRRDRRRTMDQGRLSPYFPQEPVIYENQRVATATREPARRNDQYTMPRLTITEEGAVTVTSTRTKDILAAVECVQADSTDTEYTAVVFRSDVPYTTLVLSTGDNSDKVGDDGLAGNFWNFVQPKAARQPTEELQSMEVDPKSTADDPNPLLYCGSCNSLEHTIQECMKIDTDGLNHNCPWCWLDYPRPSNPCTCASEQSLDDQFTCLVVKRVNMPAFYSDPPWFEILRQYRAANPDAPLPEHFPWTKEYALEQEGIMEDLQELLDETHDPNSLPVDPATRDLAAVYATFEGRDPWRFRYGHRTGF
ncbi:hypothetical protein BKA56DRAFT_677460 [Ilyonectria sp. MPI-CAGE-AT-0026]|nr:hypothetical protein BKA56DRAFT_677460 [Ilyonectria sp. MPI-CAGE-AT-0026]